MTVCEADSTVNSAYTFVSCISIFVSLVRYKVGSCLGGSVVERRSLAGELSLVFTGPAADG